ncbi:MAG TPA: adenylate/guanylate cyclase domain-containing protein [Dehalococcoidia bacterium]|nr:adenylate/guanylate cyclase domain-containing protein [Dehalococcoidia bacterium]
MEPRIEYATTTDGLSIAYWTLGEGTPLVQMPAFPLTHVHLEWQIPEYRRWFECLAGKMQLVRYDARGAGLSARDATDFSLDAQILDLEAVADQLGLEKVALFASGDVGMTAIAYATSHPERVSHLILWCAWARRSDVSGTPQTETLRALLDKDWEIYTETVARVLLGWAAGEEARQFAAFFRECVTPEVLRDAIGTVYDLDVASFLPLVRCPTLVLQPRHLTNPGVKVAAGLATQIKDARLVLLEGASPLWFTGDVRAVLRAIGDFLGVELEPAPAPAPAAEDRGQAPVTILFTDIEGSTALTQRYGDARAQEVLRAHNEIAREALRTHGGSEIKHTGDGIMASFASGSRAISAALAMQRGFAAHDESHPEAPIRVRIGLNAGEPVAEEGDLFGTAVQMAARIAAHAEPGRVLVSNVVRELAAGKGFLFSDRGDVVLRGFEDPVRLYEVIEG